MTNFVKRSSVMKLKQHLAKADTAEQYLQLLLRYLTEISLPYCGSFTCYMYCKSQNPLYCGQGDKLTFVIKLIGSFLFCEITIPNEVQQNRQCHLFYVTQNTWHNCKIIYAMFMSVKVWILEAIYKTKAYWKFGILRAI